MKVVKVKVRQTINLNTNLALQNQDDSGGQQCY